MIGALVFGPLANRIGRQETSSSSRRLRSVSARWSPPSSRTSTPCLAISGFSDRARSRRGDAEYHRLNLRVQSASRRATMGDWSLFCGLLGGLGARGLLAAAFDPRNSGWRSCSVVGVSRRYCSVPILALAAAGIGYASSRSPARANARRRALLGLIKPKVAFAPATQVRHS